MNKAWIHRQSLPRPSYTYTRHAASKRQLTSTPTVAMKYWPISVYPSLYHSSCSASIYHIIYMKMGQSPESGAYIVSIGVSIKLLQPGFHSTKRTQWT